MAVLSLLFASAISSADVKEIITKEALKQGLNPKIALSIAKIESGFNPRAVGQLNEVGLFQVRPEYAPVGVTREQLFDPRINARVAIQKLVYYRRVCGPDLTFVRCYNTGPGRHPKFPARLPYVKKFLKALAEL